MAKRKKIRAIITSPNFSADIVMPERKLEGYMKKVHKNNPGGVKVVYSEVNSGCVTKKKLRL